MKGCGVFDLMTDIVDMWLLDYEVKASDGAWMELIKRLGECDKQLSKSHECQRVVAYSE